MDPALRTPVEPVRSRARAPPGIDLGRKDTKKTPLWSPDVFPRPAKRRRRRRVRRPGGLGEGQEGDRGSVAQLGAARELPGIEHHPPVRGAALVFVLARPRDLADGLPPCPPPHRTPGEGGAQGTHGRGLRFRAEGDVMVARWPSSWQTRIARRCGRGLHIKVLRDITLRRPSALTRRASHPLVTKF